MNDWRSLYPDHTLRGSTVGPLVRCSWTFVTPLLCPVPTHGTLWLVTRTDHCRTARYHTPTPLPLHLRARTAHTRLHTHNTPHTPIRFAQLVEYCYTTRLRTTRTHTTHSTRTPHPHRYRPTLPLYGRWCYTFILFAVGRFPLPALHHAPTYPAAPPPCLSPPDPALHLPAATPPGSPAAGCG